MWRLLLATVACAPVLLWGLEGLLATPDVPNGSEKPATFPPDLKASSKALDDAQTPRALVALVAGKDAPPEAGPSDLPDFARRYAADLWLAREYANAYRDPGTEGGEYRTAPDAFAPDRVLVKRLTDKRNLAHDAAKAREALAGLVRSWLLKCKKAGKPIAFDAKDREAATAFEAATAGKAWMPRAEWDRLQKLIQALDGRPAALDQLRLLADVLFVLDPPRGRLSSLDAADVRSLARGLYRPLLPDTLPPEDDVLLVDSGGQKDRVARDKVVAETADRKESLRLGKGAPDEFALNADPKWAKAGFKVAGGAAGYVEIRPTDASIVRRWYQENRRKLPKDADWKPSHLDELAQACRAPTRMAEQAGYRWLDKRDLAAIEKEGKELEKLGPAGANLRALIEMAATSPRLFDSDAVGPAR